MRLPHSNTRTAIILLVAASLGWYAYAYMIRPPAGFPSDELVSVPSGLGAHEIAELLYQDGVIRSPFMFRVAVTVMGHEFDMRAGDYLFKQPENVWDIARALGIGAYGLEPIRIRVPDGATVEDMADLFAPKLQHFSTSTFMAEATPLQGYLFPDTYFFLPNATAQTVIDAMQQNFNLHELTVQEQVAASGHSLSDAVIMASIIEREARTMQDRRMIAGVLWHRLAIDMPLQTDVPLSFVTGKDDDELTRSDLASSSPYNTYTHKGLPPGPIGSPSLESLLAAVTPITTNDLYYMADPSGVTHYCPTFACQRENIRIYLGK